MASILVDGLRLPVAVSGHPVLELCNTRAGWLTATPKEYLRTYPHLAVWARQAGMVTPAACADALAAADTRPREAERVRTRAIAFREALYTALTGEPTSATWDAINAEVNAAAAATRLRPARAGAGEAGAGTGVPGGRGASASGVAGAAPVGRGSGDVEVDVPLAVWGVADGGALAAPLLAVAWAAAGLLTTAAAGEVRACPGDGCGWLFRDTRGRRRWCSMAWCGNREKVRRHARRSRPTPAAAG